MDFVFAGTEDVVRGAVEHALEGGGELHLACCAFGQGFDLLFEKGVELRFEGDDVAATVADDVGGLAVVQEGVEQVLK